MRWFLGFRAFGGFVGVCTNLSFFYPSLSVFSPFLYGRKKAPNTGLGAFFLRSMNIFGVQLFSDSNVRKKKKRIFFFLGWKFYSVDPHRFRKYASTDGGKTRDIVNGLYPTLIMPCSVLWSIHPISVSSVTPNSSANSARLPARTFLRVRVI